MNNVVYKIVTEVWNMVDDEVNDKVCGEALHITNDRIFHSIMDTICISRDQIYDQINEDIK